MQLDAPIRERAVIVAVVRFDRVRKRAVILGTHIGYAGTDEHPVRGLKPNTRPWLLERV